MAIEKWLFTNLTRDEVERAQLPVPYIIKRHRAGRRIRSASSI